jgi:hypothetical protein
MCVCEKAKKVSIDEREFLLDQRTSRKIMVAGVDLNRSRTLRKKEQRDYQRMVTRRLESDTENDEEDEPVPLTESVTVCDESDDDIDPLCVVSASLSADSGASGSQMRISLPSLARECDRYGFSDRSAAAIASAILKDVGLIHEGNNSKVIDRSKVRRERKKLRNQLQTDVPVVKGL